MVKIVRYLGPRLSVLFPDGRFVYVPAHTVRGQRKGLTFCYLVPDPIEGFEFKENVYGSWRAVPIEERKNE